MVGGGSTDGTATFGRLVAKVPARRAPEVLERLVTLYRDTRAPGEGAPAFFRRVDAGAVKNVLRDLEEASVDTLTPTDYIDLAEAEDFRPDIQEGECAAP
jgi:hypothetical protein